MPAADSVLSGLSDLPPPRQIVTAAELLMNLRQLYQPVMANLRQYQLPNRYNFYTVLDIPPNGETPTITRVSALVHDVIHSATALDIDLVFGQTPIDIAYLLLCFPEKWKKLKLHTSQLFAEARCLEAFCMILPRAGQLTSLTLCHTSVGSHHCSMGNRNNHVWTGGQPHFPNLTHLTLEGVSLTALIIQVPRLFKFTGSKIEFWRRELRHLIQISCRNVREIWLQDIIPSASRDLGPSVISYSSPMLLQLVIGGAYKWDKPSWSHPAPLMSLFAHIPSITHLVISTSHLPTIPWPYFCVLKNFTLRMDSAEYPASLSAYSRLVDEFHLRGWWLSMPFLGNVRFEVPEKAATCFHEPRCADWKPAFHSPDICSASRGIVAQFMALLVSTLMGKPGVQLVCPRLEWMQFDTYSLEVFERSLMVAIVSFVEQRRNDVRQEALIQPGHAARVVLCGITVEVREDSLSSAVRYLDNACFSEIVPFFSVLHAQLYQYPTGI